MENMIVDFSVIATQAQQPFTQHHECPEFEGGQSYSTSTRHVLPVSPVDLDLDTLTELDVIDICRS